MISASFYQHLHLFLDGGSVSAYVASLGAALAGWVANLTSGKKKYAEYQERLKISSRLQTFKRGSYGRNSKEQKASFHLQVHTHFQLIQKRKRELRKKLLKSY